jgi:hypothetical protein
VVDLGILGEGAVSWNNGIRQTHRWVSIAFTAGVIANIVALGMGPGQEEPAVWVGLLALVPLVVLLLTGLYLFVLPYVSKWRSRRRAG